MNRPGFNKMKQELEKGHSAAVFVKDMSRLGRNYIEVGRLTEEFFPDNDIRPVAVSDNLDSDEGENELTPIRNLFNAFYTKDTSKKIRAVKKAQAERGEHVASRPPYGYRKDENNPKQLIIDAESGDVVRHIFALCGEGKGPSQIARQLKTEQVLTPSSY